MKKLIAITLMALAAIFAAPEAAAYSAQLEEFAKLMNAETSKQGMPITYDGRDIICNVSPSFMGQDAIAAFKYLDSLDAESAANMRKELKKILVESMVGEDPKTMNMVGELLKGAGANFVILIQAGDKPLKFVVTPQELMNR